MPRQFTPSIVCANDLLSGRAVWFDENANWTSNIHQAQIVETQQQAESLLEQAAQDSGRIAGAWLATAVKDADQRTQPTHFREKIRLSGPTFHGAQFDGFPPRKA